MFHNHEPQTTALTEHTALAPPPPHTQVNECLLPTTAPNVASLRESGVQPIPTLHKGWAVTGASGAEWPHNSPMKTSKGTKHQNQL